MNQDLFIARLAADIIIEHDTYMSLGLVSNFFQPIYKTGTHFPQRTGEYTSPKTIYVVEQDLFIYPGTVFRYYRFTTGLYFSVE